jgi:hypothetical protein
MPELRKPPARQGIEWLRQGLVLLAAQPLRLLALGLILQLLAGFSQVGVLGFLFLLMAPAFGAGMLQAMAQARAGGRPSLASLFVAFTVPAALGRMLLLGGLGLVCAIVIVALVVSGSLSGLDPALLQRLEAGDVTAVESIDPAILQGALLGLGAGMLIGGSLAYYAVPLVWVRDQTAGRAIVQGLAGMLRAWRPLLVMSLLLALLSLPAALLLSTMLLGGMQGSTVLTTVMMLVMVAFQLLLFSTQYVSFVDIFGGPAANETAAPSDQLVA